VDSAAEAARAEVVASREAFAAELGRLEDAAREAVDIKGKIKRSPARAAGLAAGAGFLAVGGPGRLARGVGRVVRGRKEPLPPSLLPKEIDRALSALGDDGEKVRGTLEREFAGYLEKRYPNEKNRRVKGLGGIVASSLIVPIVQTFGRRLAGQLGNLEDQELKKAFEGFRQNPASRPPAGGKPGSNPPGAAPGR
jgi:hypothetical protein